MGDDFIRQYLTGRIRTIVSPLDEYGVGGEVIRGELTKMFERQRKKRARKQFPQDLALVGLLFARPSDPYAKENIVPELDYFNSRSGEYMDLFCVGYTKNPNSKLRKYEPAATVKGVKWWFNNDSYTSVREEIAEQSSWKYSGGTELLIANARTSGLGESFIDYSSAIPCKLESMQEDKAIKNVREFFEKIFKYAEDPKQDDPAFGLSDEFGKDVATNAVKKFILHLLLRSADEEYVKARHFVLSDLSKKT